MNTHLSLTTTVQLTTLLPALCVGQENTVDVLVRIQAPDAGQDHIAVRPPQAIALVIDRSGSMSGRPIAEARRCAEYVIGNLRPTDSVSLVQFDNRVQRLWPAVPLGTGVPLRAAIGNIRAGGNTHLHGGWREGVDTLADVPGNGLKRVILLSDGQANEGLTDPSAIAGQCGQWAAKGITTSTYGLGNSFNEDLMVAMARAGGGNHYYGDTAEDLMDPFRQELELLHNLCLRGLVIKVDVAAGDTVEMVNELPEAEGGWRLPDLAWGAEAWAMIRLKIPEARLLATGGTRSLLRVTVVGQSLGGDTVQLERAGLALPILPPSEFARQPQDELVARRLVELEAAGHLSRMRSAADAEDWGLVDRLLEEACSEFAGNQWVSAMLEAMRDIARSRSRERMMKESLYSSVKLRNRLVAKDEDPLFSVASESAAMPAYLRRKPTQGKGDG